MESQIEHSHAKGAGGEEGCGVQERGTVTYVSNLFDTFFPGGKDHRLSKPSAAHMPYLEGAHSHGAETA